MEFKYCSIDPYKATKAELELEISRLGDEMHEANNTQQAYKLFINSAYGAIGNEYFQCYNPDVAEAITLQGQDMIKHMYDAINNYFTKSWHLDEELHEQLGIRCYEQVHDNVVVYGDTDSLYVSFAEVFKTIEGFDPSGQNFIDMIRNIYKYRLKDFFKSVQGVYARSFNTDDIQLFEMEKISKGGVWLAKKKYVLDVSWEDSGADGIFYLDDVHLVSKGIETAQSSTPKVSRDIIEEMINYIFTIGKEITIPQIIKKLKTFKSQFKLEDVENISSLKSVSDYNKYVINDRTGIELELKCPMHLRAAAIYNYQVNSKKEWKNKYNLIKAGDKIKYFYVKDANKQSNVFGFLPGEFPFEFAPEIDYDITFQKQVIDPLNRFVVALGKPEIPSNLVYSNTLF